jgi:uncharacterized repeat protein (TIGR03803 family)
MKTPALVALLGSLALTSFAATPLLPPAGDGTAQSTPPADYRVVHSFLGKDGNAPNWLIQGRDGFFYGTTFSGGPHTEFPDGAGVIFRVDSAGNFTVLHSFGLIDGYIPSGLMQAQDGSFYGTTLAGGSPTGGGAGTLFRMDVTGALTTLHAFDGGQNCCDGGVPNGPPIQGTDGKFYGVTFNGGAIRDADHPLGFGTVYRYDPSTGLLTIIHSFDLADGNGINPNGPLRQGSDGFLYGTTGVGGGVFRMDTAGNLTLLHAITDSNEPLAGLIQAADGALYGTTDGPPGTVFRIDTASNYSLLNRFDGLDGSGLTTPVTQASNGSFYGTAQQGGLLDPLAGDLFQIDSSGALRVLHSFTQSDTKSGYLPFAPLIQGNDGALYGTTASGGDKGHGAIFRLDLSIPQPIASVVLQPPAILPGGQSSATVTLAVPAQATTTVTLATNASDLTIPASVQIAKGASSATFTVGALANASNGDDRVYASINGQATRAILTVGASQAALSSFTVTPSTVVGGNVVRGTVILTAPAPAGGAAVALSANSSSITMPAIVTVPAGKTNASFSVKTRRVRATTIAALTASYSGSSLSANVTITP